MVSACSGAVQGEPGVTVDTLQNGVVVVRNEGPGKWDETSAWRLVEHMVIGSRDGQGPQAFGLVKDFEVDEYGRLYVLDLFAQEVRVFDRDGEFVRTIGRPGSGPGEFSGANGIMFDPAGRLWVVNPGNVRYSVFDTTGTLLDEPRRPAPQKTAEWRGVFSPAGDLYDWVLIPGSRSDFFRYDTTTNQFVDGVAVPPVPQGTPFGWGHRLRTAHGWRLAVASEYRIYDATRLGDTVRVIERAHQRAPLVGDARAQAIEELESLRERARVSPDIDVPTHRRIFQRLIVDDENYLWVMLTRQADSSATTFDVFDPAGRYLGAVTTPHRADSLPPPIVRGNRMVFSTRDELDVPFVVMSLIEGR